MDCDIKKNNGITHCRVAGNVQRTGDCKELKDKVSPIAEKDSQWIVLDLSHAKFVTAGICSVLVSTLRKAKEHNSHLSVVVPPKHPISDVFRVTSLDQVLEVYSSLEVLEHRLQSMVPTPLDTVRRQPAMSAAV